MIQLNTPSHSRKFLRRTCTRHYCTECAHLCSLLLLLNLLCDVDVGIAPLEALRRPMLLMPLPSTATTHSCCYCCWWRCWRHTTAGGGVHGLPTVSPDWLLRVLEAMLMMLVLVSLMVRVIHLTVGVEESVAQFLLKLAEHYIFIVQKIKIW